MTKSVSFTTEQTVVPGMPSRALLSWKNVTKLHFRVAKLDEKLNDRYRLAITLRYQQGLPIEEIAAVLQCSEGTTKSMLFRGVRQLRQALGSAI